LPGVRKHFGAVTKGLEGVPKGFGVPDKGLSVTAKGFLIAPKGFAGVSKPLSAVSKGFSMTNKPLPGPSKTLVVTAKGLGVTDKPLFLLDRLVLSCYTAIKRTPPTPIVPQIRSSERASSALESGYKSTSTNRAQTVLDKVQITAIENAQSGELKVRIVTVANAKGFDGRIKSGNGDWSEIQSFANSRSILFKGLTPGTVYTIEIRAVGGSTGAGDWSDPVSHMAM
jgi:hypothetical protein